jgi:hypothetical protein
MLAGSSTEVAVIVRHECVPWLAMASLLILCGVLAATGCGRPATIHSDADADVDADADADGITISVAVEIMSAAARRSLGIVIESLPDLSFETL